MGKLKTETKHFPAQNHCRNNFANSTNSQGSTDDETKKNGVSVLYFPVIFHLFSLLSSFLKYHVKHPVFVLNNR